MLLFKLLSLLSFGLIAQQPGTLLNPLSLPPAPLSGRHILTEGGNFINTEDSNLLIT